MEKKTNDDLTSAMQTTPSSILSTGSGSASPIPISSISPVSPVSPVWQARINQERRIKCQLDALPITLCLDQMEVLFTKIKDIGQGSYGRVQQSQMSDSEYCKNPQFDRPMVAVKQIAASLHPGHRFQEIIGSQFSNLANMFAISPHFVPTYSTHICMKRMDKSDVLRHPTKSTEINLASPNNSLWMVQELITGQGLFHVYRTLTGKEADTGLLSLFPFNKYSQSKPEVWQELVFWTLFLQQLMTVFAFNQSFQSSMGDTHIGNWMVEQVPYDLHTMYRWPHENRSNLSQNPSQITVPTLGFNVRAIDVGMCQPYVFQLAPEKAESNEERMDKQYGYIPESHWYYQSQVIKSLQVNPDGRSFTSELFPFEHYERNVAMENVWANLDSTSAESVTNAQQNTAYRHTVQLIAHPCVIDWVQMLINIKAYSPIFPQVWQHVKQNGLWKLASRPYFSSFPQVLYESLILLAKSKQEQILKAYPIYSRTSNIVSCWPGAECAGAFAFEAQLLASQVPVGYLWNNWKTNSTRMITNVLKWSIYDSNWYEVQTSQFLMFMMRQMLFCIFLRGNQVGQTVDLQVQQTIALIIRMAAQDGRVLKRLETFIPIDRSKETVLINEMVKGLLTPYQFFHYKRQWCCRNVLDTITSFLETIPLYDRDDRRYFALEMACTWLPFIVTNIATEVDLGTAPPIADFDARVSDRLNTYSYLRYLVSVSSQKDRFQLWQGIISKESKAAQEAQEAQIAKLTKDQEAGLSQASMGQAGTVGTAMGTSVEQKSIQAPRSAFTRPTGPAGLTTRPMMRPTILSSSQVSQAQVAAAKPQLMDTS